MNEMLYTVGFAIAFIIPGFIIIGITNRIIPKKDKEYKIKLLDFFIYSSLNFMLWAIPIYNCIWKNENLEQHYVLVWILGILIMFISPIAISLVIIYLYKIELFRRICDKFGINSIEIEPSAWDFKFSNMKSEWVIVTLQSDKIVGGFMGNISCASSNEKERDLYINEVYTINEENEWNKVENTDGILIKQNEIKYIEFIKNERRNI